MTIFNSGKFIGGKQIILDTEYNYKFLCMDGIVRVSCNNKPFINSVLSIEGIQIFMSGYRSNRYEVFDVALSVRNVE